LTCGRMLGLRSACGMGSRGALAMRPAAALATRGISTGTRARLSRALLAVIIPTRGALLRYLFAFPSRAFSHHGPASCAAGTRPVQGKGGVAILEGASCCAPLPISTTPTLLVDVFTSAAR
jgi:hypothetical protein